MKLFRTTFNKRFKSRFRALVGVSQCGASPFNRSKRLANIAVAKGNGRLEQSTSRSLPLSIKYSDRVEPIIESCKDATIEDILTTNMLAGILGSLKLPTMNDRYPGIQRAHRHVVGAHKSTYDWIFARPGPGFVGWLKKGHRIIWIDGKAGSGKSTLMKFIRDDRRLRNHLRGIADTNRDTIIADFYFWAAGSVEQRFQTGLLMTILCRILKARRKVCFRLLFPNNGSMLATLQ